MTDISHSISHLCLSESVNGGIKMLFYGGLKMLFFGGNKCLLLADRFFI
jgi:hypothetical protein